jgi:F-type H+-transporting ATPase subunit gamma
MPTPREIKQRVISVKNTQKITRAMQMVASVKLRKGRDRILAARPYSEKLAEIARHLTAGIPASASPWLRQREVKNIALLVAGSDKGLCGAFNSNVVKKALEFIRAKGEIPVVLTILGKKPAEALRRRHVSIGDKYVDVMQNPAYSHASAVGAKLLNAFSDGVVDEVYAAYNEFKSSSSQKTVVEKLLPIEPSAEDASSGASGGAHKASYLFEPSAEETFGVLIPGYFTGQIWKIMLESYAAQQAASMTTMYAATKNAEKLIGSLTLYYNKVRQSIITKELLEIVAGAEALR